MERKSLQEIEDYYLSHKLGGEKLRKALAEDKEYQRLLEEKREKLSAQHKATPSERKQFVLSTEQDFEILERCRALEQKGLSPEGRKAVELVKSQLEQDWRKGLLEELERIEKGKGSKHLFDELAGLIQEINENGLVARKYRFESHINELISEAEEVKEAIEEKDLEHIKEEVGDVLWDWIMMCKLAEKEGIFTTQEVLEQLKEKIYRRNPHIFGDVKVSTEEEAIKMWKEIKQKEREGKINV